MVLRLEIKRMIIFDESRISFGALVGASSDEGCLKKLAKSSFGTSVDSGLDELFLESPKKVL